MVSECPAEPMIPISLIGKGNFGHEIKSRNVAEFHFSSVCGHARRRGALPLAQPRTPQPHLPRRPGAQRGDGRGRDARGGLSGRNYDVSGYHRGW